MSQSLKSQTDAKRHKRSKMPQSISETNDIIELDEIEPSNNEQYDIYGKVYNLFEKFSATRLGQYVLERGDNGLRIIENTAKWSLPQDDPNTKLERPLSWLPFLALIASLRLLRIWLSVGAVLIGNEPIKPQDVIYFIQTRRRKLRYIRVHGIKAQRSKDTTENSLINKAKKLLTFAICKPGQQRESNRHIFIHHGQEILYIEKDQNERQTFKRPRNDDDSSGDQNLTIDEMLQKYANEDTDDDDDSDFIPTKEEMNTNDDSTSTDGSSSGSSTCYEQVLEGDQMETLKPKESEMSDAGAVGNSDVATNIISKSDNNAQLKRTSEGDANKVIPKSKSIKTENLLDTGSSSNVMETPLENGPTNGEQVREPDVVPKFNPNLTKRATTTASTISTSTPTNEKTANGDAIKNVISGNENGANTMKPKTLSGFNNFAIAATNENTVKIPSNSTPTTPIAHIYDNPSDTNTMATSATTTPTTTTRTTTPTTTITNDELCFSLSLPATPTENPEHNPFTKSISFTNANYNIDPDTPKSSSTASFVTIDDDYNTSTETKKLESNLRKNTTFDTDSNILTTTDSSCEDVFHSPIGL